MIGIGVDARELAAGLRTGIGRYLVEVLRCASLSGFACAVYGTSATVNETIGRLPGVTLRVLSAPCTAWWDQVTLPAALARDRVSVFLSPYYKAPLHGPCPVVVTIHDLFFIGYPGHRRLVRDTVATWAARVYASRAAAIITDSEYSKRSIVGRLRVDAAKVEVIHVALAREFVPTPADGRLARYGLVAPYVLYVGNFRPHKNLDRLVRAFAELAGRGYPHRLVLAGGYGGSEEPLRALGERLGMADRLVFPGHIDETDLPAVYSAADLFALVSLEEGFGLPAVEALACGVPVVAADRAALPEVLGDAAVLVAPEDDHAIAAAMARVLDDRGLRDALIERGLTRASMFTPERTARRVVELLERTARTERVATGSGVSR